MQRKSMGIVPVDIYEAEEAVRALKEKIVRNEKSVLYFINAHCYNLAQKNLAYRSTLNSADFLLNDGIGIQLGAKLFGFKVKENLNGTDFIPKLLKAAGKNGFSVYLLGSKEDVANRAADNLFTNIPEINIVGCRDGYFEDAENDQVVDAVNKTKPDILIVGRGVPLQELWIAANRERLNAKIIIGAGAFLDFASAKVKRAPKVFRLLKMEWIFRLLLEPRRLWKRYLIGNFLFFIHVVNNKYKYRLAQVSGKKL